MARRIQLSSEYWRAPDGTRYPEMDLIGEKITVRVKREHFTEQGVPGDPYACGFACAVRQALDIPWAEIGLTIARVVVPDGRGGWVTRRGRVSAESRRLIEAYDAGAVEVPENGVMFTLHPIKGSDRKNSKRAAEKRSRKRLIEQRGTRLRERTPSKDPGPRSLLMRSPFRNTLPVQEEQ